MIQALGIAGLPANFPSFSEGLSLRGLIAQSSGLAAVFPFLFGGTFIEAGISVIRQSFLGHFPSFLEGLSLRRFRTAALHSRHPISLPFWRGFH